MFSCTSWPYFTKFVLKHPKVCSILFIKNSIFHYTYVSIKLNKNKNLYSIETYVLTFLKPWAVHTIWRYPPPSFCVLFWCCSFILCLALQFLSRLLHVFHFADCDRPYSLLHSGVHFRATLYLLLSSFLRVCLVHLHLLYLKNSSTRHIYLNFAEKVSNAHFHW